MTLSESHNHCSVRKAGWHNSGTLHFVLVVTEFGTQFDYTK